MQFYLSFLPLETVQAVLRRRKKVLLKLELEPEAEVQREL